MLKLASLFSSHAVFQCGISVPVWGWTEPNSLLECSFSDQTLQVKSRKDGFFMFRLSPMQYGGPYELIVKNLKSSEIVSACDIMIGEVWLASGQSNMQMTLNETNDAKALADANYPLLRMITVKRSAVFSGCHDFEGAWEIATPNTAGMFSAVAYHFANIILKKLRVAVGVINASWGGTAAEAWCSREALMRDEYYKNVVQNYESALYTSEVWEQVAERDVCDPNVLLAAKIKKKLGFDTIPNNGYSNGWAERNFDDSKWRKMNLPTGWVAAGENYLGVQWFRLAIDIPEKLAECDWQLELGSIDTHDITYFNGIEVGATGSGLDSQCWNKQRQYTVPASLITPGRNVIAVRVFAFIYEGGLIGPCNEMKMFPQNEHDSIIPLDGEWKFDTELNIGSQMIKFNESISGPGVSNSPYMLYDNMIKPLLSYAIRGVIWYQGESNENHWKYYRNLMLKLIDNWRYMWGQGDFPFYQVQLANFRTPQSYQEDSKWAKIREAQLHVGQAIDCGVAVTIDCGEPLDIHPRDKKTVGERLAALVLHQTYQQHDIVPCGPVYRNMIIEDEKIRIIFDNCDKGLRGSGNGFFIADMSGKFQPASSVIINENTVTVSHKDIMQPVAVRYAWADNPASADLRNGVGLPASPFRTDNW